MDLSSSLSRRILEKNNGDGMGGGGATVSLNYVVCDMGK